jgi:hypothetical protein
MMMNEKLRKLLTLALNASAGEGEWQAAAIKFVGKLRKDGVNPEDVNVGTTPPYRGFDFGNFYAEAQKRQAARAQAQEYDAYKRARQDRYTPPPPQSDSFSSFRMPFGKYKGVPLSDIPPEYLTWLNKWLGRIDGFKALKEAVKKELESRNMQ